MNRVRTLRSPGTGPRQMPTWIRMQVIPLTQALSWPSGYSAVNTSFLACKTGIVAALGSLTHLLTPDSFHIPPDHLMVMTQSGQQLAKEEHLVSE